MDVLEVISLFEVGLIDRDEARSMLELPVEPPFDRLVGLETDVAFLKAQRVADQARRVKPGIDSDPMPMEQAMAAFGRHETAIYDAQQELQSQHDLLCQTVEKCGDLARLVEQLVKRMERIDARQSTTDLSATQALTAIGSLKETVSDLDQLVGRLHKRLDTHFHVGHTAKETPSYLPTADPAAVDIGA